MGALEHLGYSSSRLGDLVIGPSVQSIWMIYFIQII